MESLEQIQERLAGDQGGATWETRTESRTCRTCGQPFTVALRTKKTIAGSLTFGNREECPQCRQVQEQEEALEAEKEQRLAVVTLRADLRRRCGLPRKYWGETFSLWEERGWPQGSAYKAVRRWAEEFPANPLGYRSIILRSRKPGVGKTTLTACMVNSLLERMTNGAALPLLYLTGPELGLRVRATYNRDNMVSPPAETEASLYEGLRWLPLLALDDIGDPNKEPPTEHTRRMYFHIIDDRYRDALPVFLVTNSEGSELEAFLGAYTMDRLAEMTGGITLTLTGKSRQQRLEGRLTP